MIAANNLQPLPDGKPRFPLGASVATPGAIDAMESANQIPKELLDRHRSGDWGKVCAEDAQQNEAAVEDGSRIMSVYSLSNGLRVWVITESDRSATTILLPEEY
jgi:hypothetical protein